MKRLLIVVDMQNGFSRFDQTKHLGEKIKELLNKKIFDTVIATQFINYEGSQYTKILNWHRLITSPDIDLIEGLKADVVIKKNIYTCINDEFIKLLKKSNEGVEPTHVFVCGADTDCCVLKIATDLFEKGIMPVVLMDYCDSNGGPESNKAGRLVMNRLIGRNSLVDGEIKSAEQVDQILFEKSFNG